MRFIETSIELNASDIEKVEAELGIIFPLEFKEHYLQYNGGYPEKDQFVWSNGEKTTINTFASIKEEGFISLEEMYGNMVIKEPYLPVGIVPFATDDGGNLFCISARDSDFGIVYYHNNDHYNSVDKESAFTKLDVSFKHFVENLTEG